VWSRHQHGRTSRDRGSTRDLALAGLSVASVAEELRRAYPRVVAKTLSFTRSLPDAEDAVQDAIERALSSWPENGTPDSPEAWLVTVAANSHRDRLRRFGREERHADAVARLAEMSPWARIALGETDIARGWKDDLLGLLFACCHPVLEPGESAALALATVIGLSVEETAGAFVVPARTMEQRLTRARKRLRERGDYERTPPEASSDRLDAVLRALHLLFNEGYWSSDDEAPIRADLCRLAIGLSRSLVEVFPNEAEAGGLLALFLLHDARRGARLSQNGDAIPLPDQDRARWDAQGIAAGTALLEHALGQGMPGPFQIEAAISAVHCRAESAEETDWKEIAALYELLESLRPTPAVRVNRAFAVARAFGAGLGLELLDVGADYPYAHVVRGALLEELGRIDEARASFGKALANTRNRHEVARIEARIRKIGD
jgi:RNA polymerase sigma-70 factor, ECF subfamily